MIKGLSTAGRRLRARLAEATVVAIAAFSLAAAGASAKLIAHGQLLRLAPHLTANANQSSNWFGYNQGTVEQAGKLFSSITGNWVVPRATPHTKQQAEASSDWIGIGGGCIDAGCTATDSTLIQTGTEQDVSASGAPSYSAWYELVPAPSLTISSITVHPGDHMHASLSEPAAGVNVWTITLQDLTTKKSFTTTVPYSSTSATAEWIEETPLEIGTNAGFAALPNLTNPAFRSGTTNGATVVLKPSEQMDLTDSSGKVIGAPSAPIVSRNGFNACAWASRCP
jgi:hypothetical protein